MHMDDGLDTGDIIDIAEIVYFQTKQQALYLSALLN